MQEYSVVIADDHPIFLKGLNDCLEQAGITIVASVTNGKDALASILEKEPDLAILDISMPGLSGLEVAQTLRYQNSPTAVILLSLYREKGYIARAKELDVAGYLLKDNSNPRIIYAVKTVLEGGTFFEEELDRLYQKEISPLLRKLERLTPSEKKILRSMGAGAKIKKIAEEFMISPRTVEKHRENINRKLDLGFTDKLDLLLWAVEHQVLLGII